MTVYADNAATTKMSHAAIDAMLPYLEGCFGNPSSLYRMGREAAGRCKAPGRPWQTVLAVRHGSSLYLRAAARPIIRPSSPPPASASAAAKSILSPPPLSTTLFSIR